MKKAIIITATILGIFLITAAVLTGSFIYVTTYKVETVDMDQSPDGNYKLILESVGEPEWPFGRASGRLVLSSNGKVISKTDIKIPKDGNALCEGDLVATWYEKYVEVFLYTFEQEDKIVILYYDGKVEELSRLKENNTQNHIGNKFGFNYRQIR